LQELKDIIQREMANISRQELCIASSSSSSSSALQPWVGLGLLLRFHNNIVLQGGVLSLMHNP
jgi:hypothetical protein